MKRRDFLRRAVPVSAVPFLVSGLPLKVFGRSPLIDALTSAASATDRVFVLIQMSGGNDGLNMVIPLDQYSQLAAARSNIMIDQAKVLPLTAATGLHPSMTGLQSLYNSGKLSVIQSVGYPTPNFSHFRATDIWLTAADYNQVKTTGWMGRYLDAEFPGYPEGYPSAVFPDPPAIQIGSVVSPGLQGPAYTMGLAISDPNSTFVFPDNTDIAPNTPAGHELEYVRQIAKSTQVYSVGIKAASSRVTNKATYPTGNTLADQLKIVARLIAGGLKTRIYVVGMGGFDTHASQVVAATHETGTHATLLGRLSAAIAAFMDDLKQLGADQRVIGMTFSEFGRRIKSNANSGTDHGAAAPVFVFGSAVQGGIIGTNPVLPAAATVNDNIALQYDFRRIYYAILRDWFGAPVQESTDVLKTPLYAGGQGLPIIASSSILAADDTDAMPREFVLEQNYPNPFNPTTVVGFQLPVASHVQLVVYDLLGREVATLLNEPQGPGPHSVQFDGSRLPSGKYFYRLQADGHVQTKSMTLVR